jgi:hypothetical protein
MWSELAKRTHGIVRIKHQLLQLVRFILGLNGELFTLYANVRDDDTGLQHSIERLVGSTEKKRTLHRLRRGVDRPKEDGARDPREHTKCCTIVFVRLSAGAGVRGRVGVLTLLLDQAPFRAGLSACFGFELNLN